MSLNYPLTKLKSIRFNLERNSMKKALKELAGSIQELGMIQPITVRKIGFNAFQLVSGERRFRAAKMIGLATFLPMFV